MRFVPKYLPMAAFARAGELTLVLLVLTLAGLFVPTPIEAAPTTLWQIGTFDDSPFEFHGKIDYTKPADDLVYVVGKSDPTKDWVAVQPAAAPPSSRQK